MNATAATVWRCVCGKVLPVIDIRGEAQVKCRYCKAVNLVKSPRVVRIAN